MTMPGNPHEEVIQAHAAYGISPEAAATMALAFEVRTANLIAIAVAQDQRGVVGDRYWEEVAERLGLGGDES